MTSKTNKFRSWLADSKSGKIVSFLLIVPLGANLPIVGAVLILLWRFLTRTSFRSLGLSKPANWPGTIMMGILLGIFLKLLFKSAIMPLVGSTPSNGTFEFLQGNLPAAISFGFFVIVSAGFCEELVFRGYLFSGLQKWVGQGNHSKVLIVIISSLIFGYPHIYQGTFGAIQAGLMGLILGSLYFVNRQNLWLLIIAHASFDLTAIYLIYNNLEQAVASFFF